ncbi:putative Auxin-induced protein 5NG4 [Cinnamomum micranthum f. kanehirae]|uniref:Putative Auxin-induced protein 5NG4 n=1 Tax=Cinnamomum micranthum f. kanehirae TaxID=337451 RepID=A0A3S3PV97_9MAGN|nr:putative Auxin-induced protein 5NG4 [Cinnamomum micranthum f. kanehirae]
MCERQKEMESVYERAQPYLLSVLVSISNAGYNIISKVALEKGMSPFILLVYAQVFATVATGLFTLLFERNHRPKINLPICLNIFLLGLLL